MENKKPWYQSKRFIGFVTSSVGLVTLFLERKYGLEIEFNGIQVSNIVGQAMLWVGQGVAVYGSAVAKHKLTLK